VVVGLGQQEDRPRLEALAIRKGESGQQDIAERHDGDSSRRVVDRIIWSVGSGQLRGRGVGPGLSLLGKLFSLQEVLDVMQCLLLKGSRQSPHALGDFVGSTHTETIANHGQLEKDRSGPTGVRA
jgi:hypothetical protein